MNEKLHNEKNLMNLTLAAGVIFAILEVGMAIVSNSQAVLMDSIYDGAEAIVLALMVFFIPLLYKPVSEKKPYGYAQLESLFLLGKGGMLFAVTIGLIIGNIQMMANGGNRIDHGLIGWFELILALLSLLILLILLYKNRKVSSPLIEAELIAWKIDVFSSIGVGLAFFASTFLKDTAIAGFTVYIDQVIAIIIAMIMLPQPYHMMKDALKSLILFAPKREVTDEIKEIIDTEFERYSYETTFYDIIQTGRKTWIEVYIRSKTNMINVEQLQMIKRTVEEELREEYEEVDVQISPDIG